MTSSKRSEFLSLFHEFVSSFLDTAEGRSRLEAQRASGEAGRQNYHDVLAASGRGEDITEMVLLKLLPHADRKRTRELGAWLHNASVFVDARQRLPANKWIATEDFPKAARAILDFVKRCVNNPARLAEACAEFDAIPYIKGMQTSTLTPILNAIRPDDFAIINSKPLDLLEYFTGVSYSPKLTDYPASNAAALGLIAEVADDMLRIAGRESVPPSYLFDAFAYWLVVERKYFEEGETVVVAEPVDETVATIDDRVEFVRRRFEQFYPDENVRRMCADMLADAIVHAHALETGNWSCTYRKDKQLIRLNVGRYYAFDLRPGRVDLPIERAVLTEEEEEALGPYLRVLEALKSLRDRVIVEAIIPVDRLGELRPIVERAHGLWIDMASATSRYCPWRRAHEPAVSEFLSDYLGREVPNPIYIGSGDEPEASVDDEPEISSDDEPEMSESAGTTEAPSVQPLFPLESVAEETGFPIETLGRWVRAIERKKQAVLYGPPGTGKTFLAEHLARHLVGGGDGFCDVVQFHPAYSYEEFVQGVRPQLTKGGALDYKMQAGRFLEFCEEAAKRSGTSVLIIDEINRADLARVFGELLYLLEYRGRGIRLAGAERFHIPESVRIIGTMNTADRSIALVDHALRRRFAFLELRPEYEVLRAYLRRHDPGFPADGLVEELRRLNEAIGDPHYEVGISFFMRSGLDEALPDIWRMEIEPYLREYFFDQLSKAEKFRWEEVSGKIGAGRW